MDNLEELAALQNSPAPSVQPLVIERWLIFHGGKQYGPHSRDELSSMIASGMLDGSAHVWREGWEKWQPISSVLPGKIKSSPISYASAKPAAPRLPRIRISLDPVRKYRRAVGLRSFIFQIWLIGWTIGYVLWVVAMIASGAAHAVMAAWSEFPDMGTVLTSGWMSVFAVWALVAFPLGIAAVATLNVQDDGPASPSK